VIEATHPDFAGPLPDYCCAILVDSEGRFLLERRPSHKLDAPGRLTCFGGLRKPDEDPSSCIRRELIEELGFVPAALSDAPAVALRVDGRLIAWFYAGRLDPGEPAPRLEPDVVLVRLTRDELDHPDVSTWHLPVLRWWDARWAGAGAAAR
jgi:8-oxo-dGTP pyrophosphatase MutT (NUDIX family)